MRERERVSRGDGRSSLSFSVFRWARGVSGTPDLSRTRSIRSSYLYSSGRSSFIQRRRSGASYAYLTRSVILRRTKSELRTRYPWSIGVVARNKDPRSGGASGQMIRASGQRSCRGVTGRQVQQLQLARSSASY